MNLASIAKKLNLGNFLIASQIIVSLLLIVVILIQAKGAGLGAIFGGASDIYKTKRGLERGLHIFTIILATLFLTLAFLNLVARQ